MPGKEHRGPKCETGFARAVADSAPSRPVILSTEARADVERLHDWLFGKNALAADRLLDVFDEAFESLADISDRGRHADDAGLRELIVPFGGSRYVVRYEVGHDQVRVTRIWHGLEDRQR